MLMGYSPEGTTLLVAAGGGGDALASLLISHRLVAGDKPPIVASYSWDRRLLDPLPGPRSAKDFEDAQHLTPRNVEITDKSRLRFGGRSSLSLLAQTTTARFVLLDPSGGAVGMRRQLLELAEYFSFRSILLVDVGGDLLATGTEAELRSPLADALALASLADFPVPVRIAMAGAGLDGELSPSYVRSRCITLGGKLFAQLDDSDVEPYFPALAEHPSEATTLLAAAALGVTGRAEIRDNADLVSLAGESAGVYILGVSMTLAGNQLAKQLIPTRSMTEAESATLAICGRSELSYERQKAETLHSMTTPTEAEMRRSLEEYWSSSSARGVTLVTFRRLGEVMRLTSYDSHLIRSLAGSHAHEHLALCSTAA
jgi:hypothetical protein